MFWLPLPSTHSCAFGPALFVSGGTSHRAAAAPHPHLSLQQFKSPRNSRVNRAEWPSVFENLQPGF